MRSFSTSDGKGATGFDGDTDTTVACRALGDSLTPGKCNCQSRTGTRSLISCDVLPSEARGGGRARCSGLVQGWCSAACGREHSGLATVLSLPMGVDGREFKLSATHVDAVR